jgi:hypothetical protein
MTDQETVSTVSWSHYDVTALCAKLGEKKMKPFGFAGFFLPPHTGLSPV